MNSTIYEKSGIYPVWLKYANERDILERVLDQRFKEWCPNPKLSFLEVGCGFGSAAKRFFNLLEKHNINYTYLGIDPYPEQLEQFRESYPNPQRIKLSSGTFEDFTTEEHFDLGLAIHSLYYTQNLQETLVKLHHYADKVLIVHHGEYGVNTIQRSFLDYADCSLNKISTHNDIAKALDVLGLPYQLNIYHTQMNINPCKDPQNDEGQKMIKFFLEQSELSEEIIEKVSAFFRTMPDIIRQDIGVFLTFPK